MPTARAFSTRPSQTVLGFLESMAIDTRLNPCIPNMRLDVNKHLSQLLLMRTDFSSRIRAGFEI